MKKAAAYLLLVVLIASSLAGCGTAPEFDTEVNMMVNLDREIGEISPYIYGQFIEHIETCIYNGIWSEMVLDRKFYYEVGNGGFSPWKASDENLVVSQQERVYSDNGYAPTISPGGAIYQKEMTTEKDKQYILEIEYIDFGNGNILYYPQFCEDFYVNAEKEFIYPNSCFNIELLKPVEAQSIRIGFHLPEGGSINEVVILGK